MSDKEEGLMPLIPEHAAILGRCASAFCHAVKEKFNCTAILHNVKEAASFGSNTGGVWHAEKRYSTKLSSGVEVSVWKDDLTRHNVEAVVNAANEKLKHGGGLAQALCDAGGPMIQKYSDDIIKQHGRVTTGEAVLTPAGNLPCKCIIHAVGPKVSQNPCQKEVDHAAPFLFNTVLRILNIVVDQNITSVAIPALSSGLFNFPRDQCADIIVNAIKQFHGYGGFQGKNLEIHLVNNDEPSVREMERATRMIFNPTSISASYSGAVKGQNQTMTTSSSNSLQICSLRFENLTLYLKKGSIEEEEVDVIVNTISPDCDLTQGLISAAILTKAGMKIQDEISKKKKIIDVSCAAIEVESMLCQAQEYFSEAEERDMLYSVVRWSCKDVPCIQTPEISAVLEKAYLAGNESYEFKTLKVNFKYRTLVDNFGRSSIVERTCLFTPLKSITSSFYGRVPVTRNDSSGKEARKPVDACKLHVVKMEKLENMALKQLFDMNMQRVKEKPKRLYQCVSAQFCDLICRVGFQKEFAPPAEQNYGSGIYFSSTVDGALKLWKNQEHEQYTYIIQAQVLTGKYTIGAPQYILPPPLSGDPLDRYDSLSDMGEKHVIFSSHQALPEYLFICAKQSFV
ncbi:poly [ADP-ribose] polymerase 9 [Labeo rohita]|uniref:Poly [ADP-ribose] polymerase 9 n=1 Tax=Labeo rohita TaxID=84645 RepID=A0A498NB28_LABRO|nr:poly [ADP-ribose] polymerase 9 [Labeo rohita]